jgi:hypothetical protein
MFGNDPVNVYINESYIDAGASARDYYGTNLTSRIVVTSNVNTTVPGTYTITYSVEDDAGNEQTSTRTVHVLDNVAPTVAFGTNGNSTYAKSKSTTVTVSDISGVNTSSLKYQWTTSTITPPEESFSTTFTNGGTITSPSGVTGEYYLWILGKDSVGNTMIARSNVFNLDNTKPIITLTGSNPATVSVGNTYIDAGATATDSHSGINGSVTVTGSVNTNVAGSYTITYTVSDNAGNAATSTRIVNVIDNIIPTVAFAANGSSTYAKTRSTTVTVSDAHTGVNTSTLKYLWNTSTTAPSEASFTSTFTNAGTITTPSGVTGGYYLWILAKDNTGNTTIVRTNVFNLDNTKPIISLTGNSTVTINKGSTYADAGATATDSHSGINGSVTSTGSVNPNIVGTYTITYTVSDNAGNAATSVTRTINVIDVLAPVITLNGSNPTNINVNSTYADAGATATDDVDGNVTSRIVVTGTVNPSVAGTYTITYTVKDNANNTATKTRTVKVIDNVIPTVAFAVNGNGTYAKSRSTTVTVSDAHTGVNTSTLKYLWNTSTTAPSESSFASTFTNGGTITSPSGVTGGYYLWILAKDNAGNTTIVRTNVFNLDNTVPTISKAFAGTMMYNDPTFASGINGVNVYNNSGNGVVTVTRTAISGAPEGSGYGLTIKTTASTSSPGWGGFYFANSTSANKTYITRIVAKIPVGYSIEWASNPIGSGGTSAWLTSTAGTGDWQEYVCQVNAGSSGSFSSTNFFYIYGGATPTSSSPLIWYVAYATVFDTTEWGTSNNVTLTATDSNSGIVGYGINQSSSTAPTYTAISSDQEIGKVISNITSNGTYYVWVKDALGNASNKAVTVSYVDRIAPTVPTVNLNGYTSGSWTKGNVTQTLISSDSGSGLYKHQYSHDNTNWTDWPSNPWVISWDGQWTFYTRAVDKLGNVSASSSPYIIRRDTVAPVITRNGSSTVTINAGTTYTDAGATATDAHSGINGNVTSTGTVNPNVVGTYIITYNVSDKAGNAATPVTRTVNVIQSSYAFNYTGSSQTFTAPYTGNYRLETYGAQGGGTGGGKGGYTIGTKYLTAGQKVYVEIGGQGKTATDPNVTSNYGLIGGYNGGGDGGLASCTYNGTTYFVGSGGGGTSIRVEPTFTACTNIIRSTDSQISYGSLASGRYISVMYGSSLIDIYLNLYELRNGSYTRNTKFIRVLEQTADHVKIEFIVTQASSDVYLRVSNIPWNTHYINTANIANTTSDDIIVAGGGGGGGCLVRNYSSAPTTYGTGIYVGTGGAGGGTTGGNGIDGALYTGGYGGTQTAGGTVDTHVYSNPSSGNGSFAYGGSYQSSSGSPGGGGGYYGGGSGYGYTSAVSFGYDNGSTGGGGGSSYTGGVTGGSTTSGVRSGNGYAVITYIGQ